MTFYETLLLGSLTALITTTVAYIKIRMDFNLYKTEVMAEKAARRLLRHKSFVERRFEAIKNELGGWDTEEDELRKILVRAGAVRTFRKTSDGKEEWWYLLSREKERIRRIKAKKAKAASV